MGVSGSGKSTVGRRLAESLGWTFADADDFHPPANIAKMQSGQPLNDADRGPWLDAIRAFLDARRAAGESCVLACSALKAHYRARLFPDGEAAVTIVFLKGAREVLEARLRARQAHFMPAALLDSQLAALEEPAEGTALVCDIREAPAAIVRRVRDALGA